MAWVNVWDVGHGVCVSVLSDDSKLWLFDCGHGEFVRPSEFLAGDTIHRLTVANYDHDHISDLANLARKFNIRTLTRNPSITAHQLRTLKLQSGPIGAAMETLLSMIGDTHTAPAEPQSLQAAGVSVSMFWNRYGNPFTDTNNISLVTFLHVHRLHMVLPGDLEKEGWETLLRNADFCRELSTVNVFMASHHGRENGYCADVFKYCTPQLVVMSDCEKKHSTQEMASTYASHATGCVLNGRQRRVLTTRSDGSIYFNSTAQQTIVELANGSAAQPALGLGLGIYGTP